MPEFDFGMMSCTILMVHVSMLTPAISSLPLSPSSLSVTPCKTSESASPSVEGSTNHTFPYIVEERREAS